MRRAPLLHLLLLAWVPAAASAATGAIPVTGTNPGFVAAELAAADRLVEAWMRKTDTPGLSLAFSRGGRLVLVRAYGHADVERGEVMTPRHRLRIASVSKPVTSAAIAKVVAQRELAFDSKVFGAGGMLGTIYGRRPYGPRLEALTVDHLMSHTSGAWGNSHIDPMFMNPAWSLRQLIDYTLDNLPHEAAPGEKYDYSNFGYALLGRIVERRTGQRYEQYVRKAVLEPAGITGMEIGGNTLAERRRGEARYYPASSYRMSVTRMEAHGGWIATPTDPLRFLVRVDRFDTVPDQLPDAFLRRLFTGTAANPRYGRGWSVDASNNYWHAGSMPGTSAILVRTHDGFGWTALANARPADEALRDELDRLMWQIRRTLRFWPPVDLF